jgi:hypothetical protein
MPAGFVIAVFHAAATIRFMTFNWILKSSLSRAHPEAITQGMLLPSRRE